MVTLDSRPTQELIANSYLNLSLKELEDNELELEVINLIRKFKGKFKELKSVNYRLDTFKDYLFMGIPIPKDEF